MKRNYQVLRIFFRLSASNFLKSSATCIIFLFILSSCNTESKRRYKFQSESMHWLQFRGPNASGIAPENADPPIHFSADTNLLWKTEILPGWSSPCIVNEKIFLTGFNDLDSLLYIFAINRENGEVLWRDSVIPNGIYNMHPINSYANPTIASDGERIVATFMNYGVVSYDLDGNKLWEYPHEIIPDFYGGACSPIIWDSIAIVKIDSDDDPRIMAFDCLTGDSVWTLRPTDNEWSYFGSNSTLIIWNNLLVNHGSKYLVAYDLSEMDIEWWLRIPGNGVATPVVSNDYLILNSYVQLGEEKIRGKNIPYAELLGKIDKNENGSIEQDEFSEDMWLFSRPEILEMERSSRLLNSNFTYDYFDENEDGSIDETEWNDLWDFMTPYMIEHGMMAISLEGSGERPFEDIKWKVNEDTPETPSPLIVNEHAFFIKNGGITTVIHKDSGHVVLKERLGAPGAYVSSPLLAGNRIYTCSFSGTITVISAEDYSVLAQNKLKEKIGASPVAVDDVLYIRTNKHLYAFREQ